MPVEEFKFSCSIKQHSSYPNTERDPRVVTGEQPLTTGAQTDLPNFSSCCTLVFNWVKLYYVLKPPLKSQSCTSHDCYLVFLPFLNKIRKGNSKTIIFCEQVPKSVQHSTVQLAYYENQNNRNTSRITESFHLLLGI